MGSFSSPHQRLLPLLLVEASPDASLLFGPDGRLRAVNDLACTLLGRHRETVLGCTLEDLTHPAERETVPANVSAPDGRESHLHRRRLVRGDGSTVVAEIASRELEFREILCSIRAIPEQRATLSGMDGGAQHDSDRALSARIASRQVRTLLNGVLGMAELLAETGLNDEQLEYVQTIRECGESLLAVVSRILECIEHPVTSTTHARTHAVAHASVRAVWR